MCSGEGGAFDGEAGEKNGVEGRGAAFDVKGVGFGRDEVGEVELDESGDGPVEAPG